MTSPTDGTSTERPDDDSSERWSHPGDSTLSELAGKRSRPDDETRAFFSDTNSEGVLDPDPEPVRHPVLVVLEGRGSGEQFLLQKDRTLLGREMEADVILKDGRISRIHARIDWKNVDRPEETPQCLLEDLDSRNGITVNGRRVQSQWLRDGDRVLLGGVLLGFYVKDEGELSYEQRLLTMATTDSLTGLANRMFFESEARKEMERARRYKRALSLLAIDLDFFKRINDLHGHVAGDRVLRQFARLILVTVRKGDVVGRVGGEEFGVLLPETALEGAVRTAERIRQRAEKHAFQHQDTPLRITVSIGVAEYSDCYDSRTAFFEAADQALYRSKDEGRNRVSHAAEITDPPSAPTTHGRPRE